MQKITDMELWVIRIKQSGLVPGWHDHSVRHDSPTARRVLKRLRRISHLPDRDMRFRLVLKTYSLQSESIVDE